MLKKVGTFSVPSKHSAPTVSGNTIYLLARQLFGIESAPVINKKL